MRDATAPVREVEAKWEVRDERRVPALLSAIGVPALALGRTDPVHDVYFDTADRAILGAGYGWRLRRLEGGGYEATLKSFAPSAPSGLFERTEWTARVAHPSPEPRLLPDGVLRGMVSSLARGRPLVPLARVTGRRTRWRVAPEPGLVVEVTLDRVRTSAGGKAARRVEVEAELVTGEVKAFAAWIASLRAGGARPSRASKLEHALALGGVRLPSPAAVAVARLRARSSVSGFDPAAEAAAAALARGAETLAAAAAAAARGSVEGAHDLRTTSRRLRAVLGAFRDEVSGAARDDLRRGLRTLRRAAGPLRDADVLREALAAVPSDARMRPGLARLRAALLARRRAGRRQLSRVLAMPRVRSLPARIAAAAEAALARPSPPFVVAGAGRLPRALEEALARAAGLPRDPSSAPQKDLHALRIAIKRARYAAEVFEPAFGKPVARLAKAAREAQDVLGRIQDARAQRAVLASLLGDVRSRAAEAAAAALVDSIDRRARRAHAILGDVLEELFDPSRLKALGGHLMKRAAGAAPRRTANRI